MRVSNNMISNALLNTVDVVDENEMQLRNSSVYSNANLKQRRPQRFRGTFSEDGEADNTPYKDHSIEKHVRSSDNKYLFETRKEDYGS